MNDGSAASTVDANDRATRISFDPPYQPLRRASPPFSTSARSSWPQRSEAAADSDDVMVAISNTFGYFYQWDPVGHGLLALDGAHSDHRDDARRHTPSPSGILAPPPTRFLEVIPNE